jgi:hypothetical protein
VSTKLGRDGSAGASRASKDFSPLPVAGAQTRDICKVGRERSRTIGRYKANDNTITQSSSPVWVELSVDGRRLTGGAEVASSLSELVLVNGNESLAGQSVMSRFSHSGGLPCS